MRIPFDIIKELWEKENLEKMGLELDATDTQNAQIFGIDEDKEITINLLLTKEYLEKLEEQEVEEIALYYNESLVKLLTKYYPDKFPSPDTAPFQKINTLFEQFKLANKLSSYESRKFKERTIKLLQDVIITEGKIKKIVAHYGLILDENIVEKLKKYISGLTPIKYKVSESGVLLVNDESASAQNPKLLRLRFMVLKILKDSGYKNFKIVNVLQAFREYFMPSDKKQRKLIIFIGETPNNNFIFKSIKLFDPFSKTLVLNISDLSITPEKIFDRIIKTLGEDYASEYKTYTSEREDKNPLSPGEVQRYRKIITEFARKFSIKKYVEIAYDIMEKDKYVDMFQPRNFLHNTITDLGYTPDRIFDNLIMMG